MNRLGEEIKEKRESKGMSIEELSEKTMLSTAIIKDIENGAFDRYEGDEAYVKMYLKKISTALDMDKDEVTKSYIALTEEIKREELEEIQRQAEIEEANNKDKKTKKVKKTKNKDEKNYTKSSSVYQDRGHIKIIRGIIIVLLVALIIAVAWIGINSTKSNDSTYTKKSDTVSGEVATDDNEDDQSDEESSNDSETKNDETTEETTENDKVTVENTSGLNYTITIPDGTDEFTFKTSFNNRTFAYFRENGDVIDGVEGKVYNSGEKVEFTVKTKDFKSILVHIANNQGTKFYVNDEEVTLPDNLESGAGADFNLTVKES